MTRLKHAATVIALLVIPFAVPAFIVWRLARRKGHCHAEHHA